MKLIPIIFLIISICTIIFAEEEVRLPKLKVDGIMYDKEDPMAIVNNQLLRKGDIIEGAKIIEITESEVTFQYNDKIFTRTIGEEPTESTVLKEYFEKPQVDQPIITPVEKPQVDQPIITPVEKPKIDLPVIPSKKTIKSRKELEKVISGNIIKLWGMLLIIFLVAYIYMSAMVHIIANKTGTGYGWMAWIPIVNFFLWCMIAEKSFLWLLIFLIPYFGPLIFTIVMWGGISESCGKSWWLGLLAVLPGLNFIIAGYLAFSSIPTEVSENDGIERR